MEKYHHFQVILVNTYQIQINCRLILGSPSKTTSLIMQIDPRYSCLWWVNRDVVAQHFVGRYQRDWMWNI